MILIAPSGCKTQSTKNHSARTLREELKSFRQFNGATQIGFMDERVGSKIPTFTNEFWTSKQRAANRLHEISYRACFKPQLPRFFIERLTKPGDIVFDPFMGRGTTLLEAALLGRVPSGCDVNPLCQKLIAPRLDPPTVLEVQSRLAEIDFEADAKTPKDLLVFYHPQTLQQICALRSYLLARKKGCLLDSVDAWIQMVALNRLTGHSPGFFSVYTMPPNQAVSIESQLRINKRLGQKPEFRSAPDLILAKTKSLIGNLSDADRKTLRVSGSKADIFVRSCEFLPEIADDSVDLVVTSPPFLNVVDYASDNWLRNWFAGLDENATQFVIHKKMADWEASMERVLLELHRILRPDGWIAFEVGEIQRGKIQLEDSVISAGKAAGLEPELVLINSQQFTKTANCWGVRNNDLGTNTNRVVLFQKAD
jgi:DNA modification methylase